MPRIYGFVFARGGSKGVPRKNLRIVGGVPLVARSVQFGLAHPLIDRMFVSTDDPEIAEVARQYGAEVPFMRPGELAEDRSPEHFSWQHAVRAVSGGETPSFDVFVSLPATCPLRGEEDVTRAIERFLQGDAQTVVTVTEPSVHPAFNMVNLSGSGIVKRFMEGSVYRRQDAPPVYELTAVCYVADPQFILRSSSYFDETVAAVEVPPERAVDIDTELDLQFAEFLLHRQRP